MIRRNLYGKYLLPIYIPVFLLGIFITVYFYPQLNQALAFVVPIFLLLIIALLFIPLRTVQLGSAQKIIPNKMTWVLAWLGLQVGVGIIFMAAMHATGRVLLASQINDSNLFTTVIYFFIRSGFYPWSLYLLLGIAIAHFSSQDPKSSPFRYALQPLLGKFTDQTLGVGIDLALKQGLFFIFAFTCAIYLNQIIQSSYLLFNLPMIGGTKLAILVFSLVFFLLLSSPVWKQVLHYFLEKKYLPWVLFIALGILILASALLFSFATKIIAWFFSLAAVDTTVNTFSVTDPMALWSLFYIILGTLLAPAIAKLIAKLCVGYSLRSVIVIGLLLPVARLIIAVLDHWLFHQQLGNWLDTVTNYPYIVLLSSVLGFILLSFLFTDPRKTRLVHLANVSKKPVPMTKETIHNIALLLLSGFLICFFGGTAFAIFISGGIMLPVLLFLIMIVLGSFYRSSLQRI
jgi:choline/glycine/proline betaine transport protein